PTDKVMTIDQARKGSKDKSKPTFKEFGMQLASSEISKRPANTLTVKFTDAEHDYDLLFRVEVEEVVKDMADAITDEQDFSVTDIKKCYVRFKKYNKASEVLGQIAKDVEVKKIDEEFLINLKIELDEQFGEDDE